MYLPSWAETSSVTENGGPQPFWHQGLVLWKTTFPRTGCGGGNALGMLQVYSMTFIVQFISIIIVITSAPPQIIRH